MPRPHSAPLDSDSGWAFRAAASAPRYPSRSTPAQAGGPQAQPQDYSSLSTPSVWRTARSQSAAAKVEALSSNGMDEIEIPAFLRKQAD